MKATLTKKLMSLLLVTSIVLSVTGCANDKDPKEEISIPILETDDVTFNTTNAEIGTISERYTLEGVFANPYITNITFESSGTIEKVYYKQNDEVKKGDLLVKLNTEEIDREIEVQQIRIDAAKKTVNTLKGNNGDSKEIQLAEIDMQIEENAMAILHDSLEKCYIYAPSNGIIYDVDDYFFDKYVIVKEARQGSMFGYMRNTDVEVLCGYTSASASPSNVVFGTHVEIRQGELVKTTGTITDIVDVGSGEGAQKVYVVTPDNKDEKIYEFGDITLNIVVSEKSDVVVVPAEAIKKVSVRTFVYVLIDGIKIETDIEQGIDDQLFGTVEVLSGLDGTETLVLN